MDKPTLDRRTFIKAGAAALTMPLFIPSHVLAGNGRTGANDRINMGCIGAGRQGRGLIGAFNRIEGVQVIARADVQRDRGDYQDYRELLERKDIDAVINATPTHWHAIVGIHAAQAGKHIYTEKPLTLTIHEGRRMVEAARRHNVVHQTGSQQRSSFANYRGCMLVRNGAIGKVKRVRGYNYPSPWHNELPGQDVPEGLDWDRWVGPARQTPFHPGLLPPRGNPGWISMRDFSGGEMADWGAHGLDQVQWALGMDDSGPVEIWTEGDDFEPWVLTEPRGGRGQGPTQPRVYMRYESGTVLELFGHNHAFGAHFIGEDGEITINRGGARSDPPERVAVSREKLAEMQVQLVRSGNHQRNFIDCIRSGERPVADVEAGHRTATVCHLGNIARWLGRRLKWDPVAERFEDDDEANALLDYERREGFELPA